MAGNGGGRWYTWPEPDGSGTGRYLRVTTIIDLGVPKQALIGWAARETAFCAVDKQKTLYAMLNDYPDGLQGAELEEAKAKSRQAAIDFLTGARFRTSTRASIKGSHVHEAIEAYKLGRPYPGVPEAAKPWYDAFLRMLDQHKPIFLQTEARVFNRERRYAGTLDTIGVWPSLAEATKPDGSPAFPKPWKDERGPVLLGDYKTGKGPQKGGVWPESALQESAYANAEFIAGPEGSEFPMPELDGAIIIHLQPGWYELVQVDIGEDVFRAFLYAYEIARWQELTSKNAVGPTLHSETFEDSKIEEPQPPAAAPAPEPASDPAPAPAEEKPAAKKKTTRKKATPKKTEESKTEANA